MPLFIVVFECCNNLFGAAFVCHCLFLNDSGVFVVVVGRCHCMVR